MLERKWEKRIFVSSAPKVNGVCIGQEPILLPSIVEMYSVVFGIPLTNQPTNKQTDTGESTVTLAEVITWYQLTYRPTGLLV